MNVFTWSFILGMTAFDIWFFGTNAANVSSWELNPFALFLYQVGGFALVAGVRGGTVAFFCSLLIFSNKIGNRTILKLRIVDPAMSWVKRRSIVLVFVIHFILLLFYLRGV